MSFASVSILNETSTTNDVSSVGVTSWKKIVYGVGTLLTKCVENRGIGGAVILFSCESRFPSKSLLTVLLTEIIFEALMPVRPILTVFVWQSNSEFDPIFNGYQSSPHGVRPLDPWELSSNSTMLSQNGEDTLRNVSIA